MTAATQPSLEDLVDGLFPGVPRLDLHHPLLSCSTGDDFLAPFRAAQRGELGDFILVVEGSIPDESLAGEGCFAGFGVDPNDGQPIPTCRWIDGLAEHAWAVVAVGTCAAYGGIHAMAGNPTGAMGLPDYLGWEWQSRAGTKIVCVPGCPVHPDSFMETLLYLMRQCVGQAPPIPLDASLRPEWLFSETVHEGCQRGGYYEQAAFAEQVGGRECIVRQGCWGPVVRCNVSKRGWINGVGGCANVGGVCNGCTMPGFPDKTMPFMDQPPGSLLSSRALTTYGKAVKTLRTFTEAALHAEPSWRGKGHP
jgi:hydrogenase small subunit